MPRQDLSTVLLLLLPRVDMSMGLLLLLLLLLLLPRPDLPTELRGMLVRVLQQP